MTWPRPHNPQEAGWSTEGAVPGPSSAPAELLRLHQALLTWSRYRGSTSARTFSVLLLISEGFSTTQFPGGAGQGEGKLQQVQPLPPPSGPHTCTAGAPRPRPLQVKNTARTLNHTAPGVVGRWEPAFLATWGWLPSSLALRVAVRP